MYRFRSIENLLGEHKELENQEIYFASPEQLNDPMEGYRDFFWKGDKIIWRNFFRNYIKSVEFTLQFYAVNGSKEALTDESIVMPHYFMRGNVFKSHAFTEQIISEVFKKEYINSLPISLSQRINPIRRSELLIILYIIHPFILDTIIEAYVYEGLLNRKLIPKTDCSDLEKMLTGTYNLAEIFNQGEKENGKPFNDFFNDVVIYLHGTRLLTPIEDTQGHNMEFLLRQYPESYIAKLENDCFPELYSASFLSDYTNSAIWGYYGDKHKGVCMKFKPLEKENAQFLSLKTPLSRTFHDFPFEKMQYKKKYISIDFFKSIGGLSKRELLKCWFEDKESGKISRHAYHLKSENEETWRNKYWKRINIVCKSKLKEWSYEKEHRVILQDALQEYRDKESRKFNYDFNDLEEIIFGIKTPKEDISKIIEIIKKKCMENERDKFSFYQAYYYKHTGKIEKAALYIDVKS